MRVGSDIDTPNSYKKDETEVLGLTPLEAMETIVKDNFSRLDASKEMNHSLERKDVSPNAQPTLPLENEPNETKNVDVLGDV